MKRCNSAKCAFLSLTLIFILSGNVYAQEKQSWLIISTAFTHPVFNFQSNYEREYNINPEIEILTEFQVFESSKLVTGLGLQSGHYNIIEDVAKLVWVEGSGWSPWEYSNHWELEFVSLYVPAMIKTPINNFFLNSCSAGIDFGAIINYNLSLKNSPVVPNEKINRYFLDWKFGLEKIFLHSQSVHFGISPFAGIRTYLTNYNTWQNNHFFYGLKLSINL
jgi:hypothetical protein